MPKGRDWPRWNERPLSFLAQVRLDELAVRDSLPHGSGILLFFYDAAEQASWGFDPADVGAWRVMHVDDVSAAVETDPPSGTPSFAPRGVLPSPDLSVPDAWEEAVAAEFNPSRVAYDNVPVGGQLCDALLEADEWRGEPVHQLLGWPTVVQNPMQLEVQLASNGIYVGSSDGYKDPRVGGLAAGAASWRLLLQLDSDDEMGWSWGDWGRLYFWIFELDLRAGCYESTWCILQCT